MWWWPFGKKKMRADEFGWNFGNGTIRPEKCAHYASGLVRSRLPMSVRVCEAAFYRASAARHAIRQCFPQPLADVACGAVTRAVMETFRQDDPDADPALVEHYHRMRMSAVATIAMNDYTAASDLPHVALHVFADRIRYPAQAAYEVQEVIADVAPLFRFAASKVRLVP